MDTQKETKIFSPPLRFSIRGKDGVSIYNGPPDVKGMDIKSKDGVAVEYTQDGSLIAIAESNQILIYDTTKLELVQKLEREKVTALHFSPKGTYLLTWERPRQLTQKEENQQQQNPTIVANLLIWNIQSGKIEGEFVQKQFLPELWPPIQWSASESYCARMISNQILFFENSFESAAKVLQLKDVGRYSISPVSPFHIATFVPEKASTPGMVTIWSYPALQVIQKKTFYKCSEANLLWSPSGKCVLISAQTEVDNTKKSYYGETSLHYLPASSKIDPVNILLKKEGPIHDVVWNHVGTLFAVVYGYLPSNTVIYEMKDNGTIHPIIDLGSSNSNFARFSPCNQLILLGGFGNLTGNVEIWDFRKLKKVGIFIAECSSYCEWSRDSRYILTAILSPRIRVDNGFTVWSYDGTKLVTEKFTELLQVKWEPKPISMFPYRPPSPRLYEKAAELKKEVETVAPKKYVPPHQRGQPQAPATSTVFKKHEDAPMKLKSTPPRGQQQQLQQPQHAVPIENVVEDPSKKKKKKKPTTPQTTPQTTTTTTTTASPSSSENKNEKEESDPQKKIKVLRKKLRQIEELKKLQTTGKNLTGPELEKLKGEDLLVQQLKQLDVQSNEK